MITMDLLRKFTMLTFDSPAGPVTLFPSFDGRWGVNVAVRRTAGRGDPPGG